MNATFRLALLAATLATALPALAAWTELRRNDQQRLSIDTASVKKKGAETSFQYLVDFREVQGEAATGVYRSVVVRAVIRCKDRTISVRESEVFPGNEAKGTSLGIRQSSKDEARFSAIEKGSSDVELYDRVCKAGAKPAPAKAAEPPAKKG